MDKIIWEIPIGILNQANHVFMWEAGIAVKRNSRTKAKDIQEIASIMGVEL